MIEMAGFIFSGVGFARSLYKTYRDFSTWARGDLPVDREWLPLAIEKNYLEAPIENYSWARPKRIPTLELRGTHEVVIFFNKDKKEAYRITDGSDRPSILIRKIT